MTGPSDPDEGLGTSPTGADTVGAPPLSIRNAVTLMFVRAAIGVLEIVDVLLENSLRTQTQRDDGSVDAAQFDTTLNVAVVAVVGYSIAFIVLYVVLALKVRQGKSWARVVVWVVAGLGVLSGLFTLGTDATSIVRLFALVILTTDVATIVLLAFRQSSEYVARTP